MREAARTLKALQHLSSNLERQVVKNKTRTNVCQSLVWALLTFSLAFKKLPKVEETYARSS